MGTTKEGRMKVVINRKYGGFGLSQKALDLYNEMTGKKVKWESDILRNDPILVFVVESLGKEANTRYSELEVVEIPDGISWYIHEYDGKEEIHETHRSWS